MEEIFKNYPDVVSVPQVSKMLNLSIPVVYRLLQSGELRAKKVGTKYVIAKKSVIEFLFSEVDIERKISC